MSWLIVVPMVVYMYGIIILDAKSNGNSNINNADSLPRRYRGFFKNKTEVEDVKKKLVELRKWRNTVPAYDCLKQCKNGQMKTISEVTLKSAAATSSISSTSSTDQAFDYHCCCNSSLTYKVVDTAYDFSLNNVTIVQTSTLVQGFFLDDCNQQADCTTCSCQLDDGYHRALYHDGDTYKIGDVIIPTSCKCFNT